MSEKIYAFLLRLYPSRFRRLYGDEAMQLLRDRLRDENGFFARLRLWLDLLFDLAVSVPVEYRRTAPALSAPMRQADGVPSFHLLEQEPLRPSALLSGSVLAFLALTVFIVLFQHIGDPLPPSASSMDQTYSTRFAAQPGKKHSNDGAEGSKAGAAGTASQPPRLLDAAAVPQDATEAIVRLFDTHNIVMLGEMHGNRQEYEWLIKLVNTPDFANRVDDIVVEFGNALYQKTVDRYVAVENISVEEVQKAWRDMVLSTVPVQPVYEEFYKAVREANIKHQGGRQLRIVLASPPVDWARIQSRNDLEPYMNDREPWYAQTVKNEVLARHHRALIIMGTGHFIREDGKPGYIESELRAAEANPYLVVFGTNVVDHHGTMDKRFDGWKPPVIVPLAGNWVGSLPAQPVLTGGYAQATQQTLAQEADALLYVAPCSSLVTTYQPRTVVDGTLYGKEVARRNTMILGQPGDFLYQETEPSCISSSSQSTTGGK